MRRLQLVGNAHGVERATARRQPVGEADENSRVGTGKMFDVVDRGPCTRHQLECGRDATLVHLKAAGALSPLVAGKPEPSGRVELDVDLLDERVDLVGASASQLRVAPRELRKRALHAANICALRGLS